MEKHRSKSYVQLLKKEIDLHCELFLPTSRMRNISAQKYPTIKKISGLKDHS